MLFKSTRGEQNVRSTDALVRGIASDGGLFVPVNFPKVNLEDLKDKSYKQLALFILKNYLDLDEKYLEQSIDKAYSTFENEKTCPVVTTSDFSYIEIFHGKTLAFKDIALSMLPYFITEALKEEKINEKVCILTATSGDTGSAAISGFADVPNVKINVLFPTKGISEVQRLQMTTVDSKNVEACAIEGNFDDAQRTVKEIFKDSTMKEKALEKGYLLSSANSINIGRLLPQVVYYFSSYFELVRENTISLGDKIDVCVPTGNFGNIMESYISKEMGLPIDKFIVASNDNNILSDFFNTGVYDTKRDFKITTSPSMDILVSSNLERLIYLKSDEETNKQAMEDLQTTGKFTLDKNLFKEFFAGYATEKEVQDEIKNVYEKNGYLLDPHTAVGSVVSRQFKKTNKSNNQIIIAGTASPYKFPKVICDALDINTNNLSDFEMIEKINEKTGLKVPSIIGKIKTSKEIHTKVLKVNEVKENIIKFL